jgi:hypothetical protein
VPATFPSSAPTTVDFDLLHDVVDEDFQAFLGKPDVTARTIEDRLERHANFYYCTLQGLTDCRIWYKIVQLLNNGTSYPLTGWPNA